MGYKSIFSKIKSQTTPLNKRSVMTFGFVLAAISIFALFQNCAKLRPTSVETPSPAPRETLRMSHFRHVQTTANYTASTCATQVFTFGLRDFVALNSVDFESQRCALVTAHFKVVLQDEIRPGLDH
jgi:hypothetical protein